MDDSVEKLTEFAAPPVESKSGPQSLFQRLFRRDKGKTKPSSTVEKPDTVNDPPPVASPQKDPTATPVARNVTFRIREGQSTYYESDDSSRSEQSLSRRNGGVRREIRTFTNVLSRIMNILDVRQSNINEGLKPYKDSDFHQSWMPDSSCKECYDCGSRFTTFLRRHHCRICGQIFCSRCCNQEVPGSVIGFEGGLRACTYCCGVISDLMDGTDDLGTLRDNVQKQLIHNTQPPDVKTPTSLLSSSLQPPLTPSRRLSLSDDSFDLRSGQIATVFDLAPTAEPIDDVTKEERLALIEDSKQLKTLFFELLDQHYGITRSSKRHRLRTYNDCFYGHELVTWLVETDKASSKDQACALGQALLEAKYVRCLTDSIAAPFHDDYTIYNLRELTVNEVNEQRLASRKATLYPQSDSEPHWIQELDHNELAEFFSVEFGSTFDPSSSIGTSYTLENKFSGTIDSSDMRTDTSTSMPDLNRYRHSSGDPVLGKEEITSAVVKALARGYSDSDLHESIQDHVDQLNEIFSRFKTYYQDHIACLCKQLLEKSHVSLSWTEIIMELSNNISHFVRPDVQMNKDTMDIGAYVHIKKVRIGHPSDSAIVYGAVCTKAVVHKKMRTSISRPSIMLLQSSLEYQRVTNKLTSLDPQILQEKEYLQNCVARICKYRPDILLVENTVSRVAQELLLEAGITLVTNVKQSVMARIARMTMAEIVPSIDSLISTPQLGTCYKFETQINRFNDGYYKSLMYFRGCPANLGCTVLLRSMSYDELVKVKPILMMMVYACYHAKLELAYMMDQSASLPPEKYPRDKSVLLKYDSSEMESAVSSLMASLDKVCDKGSPKFTSKSSEQHSGQHNVVKLSTSPLPPSILNQGQLDKKLSTSQPSLLTNLMPLPLNQQFAINRPAVPMNTSVSSILRAQVSVPAGNVSTSASSSAIASPPVASTQIEVKKFKQILHDIILDFSPFTRASSPFFETEKGKSSLLRIYFDDQIYFSHLLSGTLDSSTTLYSRGKNEYFSQRMDVHSLKTETAELRDEHEFTHQTIDCGVSDSSLKNLLATYRASGARLKLKDNLKYYQQGDDYSQLIDNEDMDQKSIDCFEIQHHQRIVILFSSYTTDTSILTCVKPWIVHMQFYARNDMTLGQFLELYCFRESYKCPRYDCDTSMLEHIRKFVYGSGSLYLIMRRIPEETLRLANTADEAHGTQSIDSVIYTWSWCRKCEKATPLVPLSPTAWHLSFARFLQIRLNCTLHGSQVVEECTHSMYKDYYQYFKCRDVVATFKYSSITLREIVFPPRYVTLRHCITKDDVLSRVRFLRKQGLKLYSSVVESFLKIEVKFMDIPSKKQIVTQNKEDLEKEKKWFIEQLDEIHTTLIPDADSDPNKEEAAAYIPDDLTTDQLYHLLDGVVRLKCHLSRSYHTWIPKIEKLTMREERSTEKKTQKQNSNNSEINLKALKPLEKQKTVIATISDGNLNDDSAKKSFTGNVCEPVSSSDPEGPVLSYEVEFDTVEGTASHNSIESITESSGSESDQLTSTDHDVTLNDFHNTVNPGLKAGVSGLLEEGFSTSLGSYDICGSADLQNMPSDFEKSNEIILRPDQIAPSPLVTVEENAILVIDQDLEASQSNGITSLDVANHKPELDQTANNFEADVTSKRRSSHISLDEAYNPLSDDDGNSLDPSACGSHYLSASPNFSENHFFTASTEDNDDACDGSPVSFDEGQPVNDAEENTSGGNIRHSDSAVFSSIASPLIKPITSSADLTDDLASLNGKLSHKHRGSSLSDLETAVSKFDRTKNKLLKRQGSRAILDTIKTAIRPPVEDIPVIENPYSDTEHYLLWPTIKIPVVIYEEELSSIIAYTLGSQKYEDEMIEIEKRMMLARDVKSSDPATPLPERSEINKHRIESVLNYSSIASLLADKTSSSSNASLASDVDSSNSGQNRLSKDHPPTFSQLLYDLDQDDADPNRFASKPTLNPKDKSVDINQHIELQFTENSVSGDKMAEFYCKVYFGPDFKKLRKLIFPDGEEQYVRSLSRCFKWHAQGGRSGLGFCKTKDERFVIKQMNKSEVQSFIEFGPHYFEYITKSDKQPSSKSHPCALARILGVYRIGCKNTITGDGNKQDVLVMENLFFGRRMGKIFDLKGSDRNRLARKDRSSDTVLLDENFTRYSKHNPIYMRSHNKKLLMTALTSDSQFLASLTVMDYSLLCGYDEDTKELVVGIIDYLRTFTWDKKLETVVKSSGILGGQGKMPTIVSPEVYRTRFLEAMERYFIVVPDRWTGLATDESL